MLWRTCAIVRARLVRIHQLFIFLLTFYLGALQCRLWCSLLSAWLVFSQFLSSFYFYFHSDIWTNIRQGINRNHSPYWNSTKFSMDRNLPCCFPSFFFLSFLYSFSASGAYLLMPRVIYCVGCKGVTPTAQVILCLCFMTVSWRRIPEETEHQPQVDIAPLTPRMQLRRVAWLRYWNECLDLKAEKFCFFYIIM